MKNEAATVHIRLLGAPGSGRSRLAPALASALAAGHGARAFIIDDQLPLPPDHPGAPVCATLLMGLDLPVSPASAALQQAADRALRDTLAQSGVSYQVVYGQGEQRLRSALSALQQWLPGGVVAGGTTGRARWVWACDNCSDPQCERRLLTDLLAARAATP